MIFSAPMVRAILEGRKTQTRRVMKPQPVRVDPHDMIIEGKSIHVPDGWKCGATYSSDKSGHFAKTMAHHAPFKIGDRFYVRETWRPVWNYSLGDNAWIYYAADQSTVVEPRAGKLWKMEAANKNRSPIHMPEWAARLHCEVTDVRAQRVQDISAKDIIAEGVVDRPHKVEDLEGDCPVSSVDGMCYVDLRSLWAAAWVKINGKESWKSNPWVWSYTFRRIEKGGAA